MSWILCGVVLTGAVLSVPADEESYRHAVERASALMQYGSVDWTSIPVRDPLRPASAPRAQTAAPVLEETAQAEDPETRLQALEVLAETNDLDHLDHFLHALSDPEPEIRELAARFVARQDTEEVFKQFMDLLTRGGSEGLARLDAVIPTLRTRFEPHLLDVLAAPAEPPTHKRVAAYCLGRMNSVAAAAPLAECAWNADETTALACVQALFAIRDPIIVGRLGELAAHNLPSVRKAAIAGLVDAGGPESLAMLGQLAVAPPNDNEDAAREAVLAMGATKMEAAIPLLIEVMRRNVAVRHSAVQALRRLAGDDAGDQPSEWQAWYERRLKAMQQTDEQSQESFYEIEYAK